ncbi:uncharacterized protein TrAtP1_010605 [Trichoderma atroviride]|uniref:uncharacterized protein n=1 Tax=Hypocrea atroviridis TaxID=63577 RepID=UPI00332788A9|nr:hypothetical protein TrAtP1_010605 [Trichoderma atroviride]
MPTLQTPQLKQLHTSFGAEILASALPMLLTDENHVELSHMFGELDDVTPYIKLGRPNRLKYDELFDVSKCRRGCFNPRRAGYSLLLAHELPPPGNGGGIEYCDTRQAYAELDQETKDELATNDYVAAHSIHHSKKVAAPDWYANINPEDYPMGRHKLVQLHETSNRMNLYIATHIHHIEGLTSEKSQQVFDKLFMHCTQNKYRLSIDWQCVGDLVVWDNTSTMHRAVNGPFLYKYRRDMRRTTVHDSSSQAWGLNEHTNRRQGLP